MQEQPGRGLRHLMAGLPPDVVRLGWVSFFADVSSEMLYPLIPVFLTSVLNAPVAVVGVIEGCAEATASLLKTVSGRLSDRTGRRRPFVFAGYTISALAKPLMALANGWPLVLFARVSDRLGKGLRTSPRDALIGDIVDEGSRGRAFGWHRAMDTMGAVVGPLIALVLVTVTNENLRLVLALSVIPGLLGAALVLTVAERRRPPESAPERAAGREAWQSMPAAFRQYLVAWAVFSLANSSDVFIILRAKQLGYSTTLVVVLYALYNLVYAAGSPSLGRLSDRLGRRAVLIGGLAVFALVYAGFAVIVHSLLIWPLFAVYGLYTAATDGVGKAFAVDLVPSNVRGTAIGLLGTVTGLSTLVASSVAGVLWTVVGPWATFAYGAAGAVAAGVLLGALPALRASEARRAA